MPKINIEQADSYSNAGGQYFTLADDGDTATVNFLLDSEDDLEIYAYHSLDGREGKFSVNCIREPNAGKETCPLCAAGHRTGIQLYIKLINEGVIKIWTRGKSFYSQIQSLLRRHKKLSSKTFEIERIGKKGDTKTTYSFYEMDGDYSAKDRSDLLDYYGLTEADEPEILGTYLRNWTFEDMEYFLDTGEIPDTENSTRETDKPNRNYHNRGNIAHGGRTGRTGGSENNRKPEPPKKSVGAVRRRAEPIEQSNEEEAY